MKACSLLDFMEELKPWLDQDHIRAAVVDGEGHFILHFMDGMKNVYSIDDCEKEQLQSVLSDLRARGISVQG
ncbi:MAG: hypothetical protein OEY01_10120 [Desulfobulbaceae bacterium]|nr:hypothetical protein [Desulfobulbaceae bacterium]HIJ79329.1 hypothetical protein [Deltaproteobacteria bacterium]